MTSYEQRRTEMFICLKEQDYYLTFMGSICIDMSDWLVVLQILQKEGLI